MRAGLNLIIFARAPVVGQTKTRLIPAYTAQGAANIHQIMTQRTLEVASQFKAQQAKINQPVELTLCVAGQLDHPIIAQWSHEFAIHVIAQQGGDLGQRMHHAFEHALATHRLALLIGTDCLTHTEGSLAHCCAQLTHHDWVFTPAHDGGYVLVGTTKNTRSVFEQINWGSSEVMQQTLERLEVTQDNYALTEPTWDIDHHEDVIKAQALGLLAQHF